MPNGHGGVPRFGSPVLLLGLLAVVVFGGASDATAWRDWLVYALAGLFGWRFAWHLWMYPVMEYGGAYASEQELATALRRYRIGAVAFAALALAAAYLLYGGP